MQKRDLKILVVGGGGREHALAWKCAQSHRVREVLVAPGNAGTALEPKTRNVRVGAEDIDALVELAIRENADLTIIGPEVPLVNGMVDRFVEEGLPCFGPVAAAAMLEGSKAYTKDFLLRHSIPTAAYSAFTDVGDAVAYVRNQGAPIVIKADGLAAGKGVIVALSEEDAVNAVREMLGVGTFGDAGRKVVIEEFLEGEETSFIVVTDGHTILPLATSQDHKARDEGDTGPNTGGMGAYSPAPVVTPEVEQRILDLVIRPTLDGLRQDGVTYRGFLYAGLMISADGMPRVIEFNCRLGDPETQPIMARLKSDLVDICEATIEGSLDNISTRWDSRASLGVVMTAGGYPGNYEKGLPISGLPTSGLAPLGLAPSGLAPTGAADCKVFHAGTANKDGTVVTSGGRVLCVVGLGDTVAAAGDTAYRQVESIEWQDVYYRKDIGHRAIARERSN